MQRLKGLDFVRFYLALSVIVYHVTYNPKFWFGHPVVFPWLQTFFMEGNDAVTGFFVLSGFLITYLLLVEQRQTHTVNVKAFYQRRALRIWPLYFTVIALGYLAIPILFPNGFGQPQTGIGNVLPLLLLLPNFTMSSLQPVISHLWSIGIEEMYYWFWPVLVHVTKSLPLLLCAVIVMRWLFTAVALANGNPQAIDFAVKARFDCMAIGGLGAYLAFHKHYLLRVLYHPAVQVTAIGLFLFTLIYNNYGVTYDLVKACIYMVYILNVATNPRAIGRIETRWTPMLGNLSFGMYMLHPFVLYVLLSVLPVGAGALLLAGTVALTLVASALSYRWLETPFLRLKARVQHLPATPYTSPQSLPLASTTTPLRRG